MRRDFLRATLAPFQTTSSSKARWRICQILTCGFLSLTAGVMLDPQNDGDIFFCWGQGQLTCGPLSDPLALYLQMKCPHGSPLQAAWTCPDRKEDDPTNLQQALTSSMSPQLMSRWAGDSIRGSLINKYAPPLPSRLPLVNPTRGRGIPDVSWL